MTFNFKINFHSTSIFSTSIKAHSNIFAHVSILIALPLFMYILQSYTLTVGHVFFENKKSGKSRIGKKEEIFFFLSWYALFL